MGGDHLWDAIGAIGQVLGSIAVFVTLVYLSIQTNHARRESRRGLSQARAEASREVNAILFTNDKVASAWMKTSDALGMEKGFHTALIEQAKLTQEEAFYAVMFAITFWNNIRQTIPYVDESSPFERDAVEGTIRFHYGPNGSFNRLRYEGFIKRTAHLDAVRYIENLLAQPN